MPNVVFMDGFDMYDGANNNTTRPGLHSKWIIAAGSGLYFSAGRYGGQSVHLGATSFSNRIRGYFVDNLFLQSSTLAFAFLCDNIADMEGNNRFFALMHNQGEQFSMSISNIGEVRLHRGSTVVASSVPNLVRTNDWHYFELEYVGNTSVGRATLFMDGTEIVSFNGNTQAQVSYGFNGIQLYGTNGCSYWVDDLYVIDEAIRIGERRIETLRPNGDLAGNMFTPNLGTAGFSVLNDTIVSADNFVSATTLGAQDMYNFSNLSTNPNTIDAVQLSVWGSKTDAETREIATLLKSGSVTTTSQNYNLPTNHLNMNRIEQVEPETGSPWTTTTVNALQAGFRITK